MEIEEEISDTFPVELLTGKGKVSITFYRHEVGIEDNKYSIARCTGYTWEFVDFQVAIPDTSERLWRITKRFDGLQIHCNGLEVLDYIFENSHPTNDVYKQRCVNFWSGESKRTLRITSVDVSTKKIRGNIVRLV